MPEGKPYDPPDLKLIQTAVAALSEHGPEARLVMPTPGPPLLTEDVDLNDLPKFPVVEKASDILVREVPKLLAELVTYKKELGDALTHLYDVTTVRVGESVALELARRMHRDLRDLGYARYRERRRRINDGTMHFDQDMRL